MPVVAVIEKAVDILFMLVELTFKVVVGGLKIAFKTFMWFLTLICAIVDDK